MRQHQKPSRVVYEPNAPIVRRRQLPIETGLSLRTIDRLRRLGEFPEPIHLSTQARGWRRADLEAWRASRPSDARTPARSQVPDGQA